MISAARPDVVVSDLSHFLGGECVTDRAAFDILTWANKQQFDLKLIVTCADLTGNRQSTSSELGAFGICNSAAELDRLVALATGVRVDHTYRSLESTKQSLETARELLESGSRRNVWWWTALFEQRLALLQTQMIHQSNVEPRATQ